MSKPHFVPAGRSEESLQKQRDQIKSISLHEDLHERVKTYAADNNMSVSEAIAEIMQAYAEGGPLPVRKRRAKRVSIWIRPEIYLRFTQRAKKEKVTIASAIEAQLEQAL